uniref:Uncharacterized protein n=1 Tax=Tanacetum cinerariifolium TaxID=118510 RepID=A0A6L2LHD8_TANCI|nr:hypothetical protein [Tanacetum cinerariifolium]
MKPHHSPVFRIIMLMNDEEVKLHTAVLTQSLHFPARITYIEVEDMESVSSTGEDDVVLKCSIGVLSSLAIYVLFPLTAISKPSVYEKLSRLNVIFAFCDSIRSITAAELSWGNSDHIRVLDPPFDFIIGTDIIGHEIRSIIVHEQMINLWKKHFEVKQYQDRRVEDEFDNEVPTEPQNLSDWRARRYEAMVARLLRDIKIT